MKETQVWKILQTMPDLERRRLKRWVRSPFVNHRADVVLLLDYLSKPGCKAERSTAFSKVWPDRPYDDDLLRQTLHWLLESVRNFLAYEEWQREPEHRVLYTARALARRGLNDLAAREARQSEAPTPAPFKRMALHYRNRYDLAEFQYELLLRQRRSDISGFGDLTQLFDNHLMAEILRLGCMGLARQSMQADEVQPALLPAALQRMQEGLFDQHHAARAYYHAYCALLPQPDDETHFRHLNALLCTNPPLLLPEEERDLYILAINYCIRRHNKGERAYTRAAFELYQHGLSKSVFVEQGTLSKFTYTNINFIALLLEEWAWADQFLQQYRDYLPIQDRTPYFLQNKAVFYFRQGAYAQTLELLQQVEFQEIFHALDARRMLLVSYYETGAIEALYSLLDSFALFIRRKQRSIGYHREHYANLLRFTRRLLLLDPKDAARRAALREEILETKAVAERAWLLKKL